jgi:hypothetical protein
MIRTQLVALGFPVFSDARKQQRMIELCESSDDFFNAALTKVKLQPAAATPEQTLPSLLGIYGHRFEQCLSELSAQSESLTAMHDVLNESLPSKHADKFVNQSALDTEITSRIYLFIQGRMKLDYSLANEFSQRAASELAHFTTQSEDEIRVMLNQSYYVGVDARNKQSKMLRWFEKWFN